MQKERREKNMKISQSIGEFRKYTEVTKSKGTTDFYKFYLRSIDKHLGQIETESITNNDILDYILIIRKNSPEISNASLNKHIVTLKTVVTYTTGRKITFQKLKEQKKLTDTISDKTVSKIFSHYQKNLSDRFAFRNYVYLRLMLDTGLRMNEMNNLKFRDIDFDTNSIHVVITKTNVDRIVCFTESTSELLWKFVVTQKIKKYLFFDFLTNEMLTTSSVECFIYRIKKRLLITESITPHKWRHTFATYYLRNGGNLETLRMLLGHSNLKTTQRYLHLSTNDISVDYKKAMQYREY